jgi:hypothetical protein
MTLLTTHKRIAGPAFIRLWPGNEHNIFFESADPAIRPERRGIALETRFSTADK